MRSTKFHCADIETLRSELKTSTEVVPVVDGLDVPVVDCEVVALLVCVVDWDVEGVVE